MVVGIVSENSRSGIDRKRKHEISQKHKTITARDKSRTERANDILLLNAYGTDEKSGS